MADFEPFEAIFLPKKPKKGGIITKRVQGALKLNTTKYQALSRSLQSRKWGMKSVIPKRREIRKPEGYGALKEARTQFLDVINKFVYLEPGYSPLPRVLWKG